MLAECGLLIVSQVCKKQVQRLTLPRASRFLDDTGRVREALFDLLAGQKLQSREGNRSFDQSMLGPIESGKVGTSATVQNFSRNHNSIG